MVLEQKVQEVSNRSSTKAAQAKNRQYKAEIDNAVQKIVDAYQEDCSLEESILETTSVENGYAFWNQQNDIVDYEKLWDYLAEKQEASSYSSGNCNDSEKNLPEEEETLIMADEEAKEEIQKEMVAAIFYDREDRDHKKTEKLKWYILTEPGKFKLLEQLCVVRTQEVNYGGYFN